MGRKKVRKKEVTCLGCDKKFMSVAIYDRLVGRWVAKYRICSNCREKNKKVETYGVIC